MTKLKSCPFCKHKAILCTREVKEPTETTLFEIGCDSVMCPCWIQPQDFELQYCCEADVSGYALKSEAIEYWNKREQPGSHDVEEFYKD